MPVTRIVYLGTTLAVWTLNCWAFVCNLDTAEPDGLISVALIFNSVVVPILTYIAYRAGEAAEAEYRSKAGERRVAQLVNLGSVAGGNSLKPGEEKATTVAISPGNSG